MKKKKQNTTLHFEPITALFNPTIEMAAELMGISKSVVEEWLAQEHLNLVWENKLSDKALDFLAKKYVSRLRRYFINCQKSWADMDQEDRALFREFIGKYGRFFFFWVKDWKDIDTKRIERDFKKELLNKAAEAYFQDFTPYKLSPIIIEDTSRPQEFSIYDYLYHSVYTERPSLLTAVSHSLNYRARIKTHIPAPPEHRVIFLEILQEYRFHIFTGESDSDDIIEAYLSSTKLNLPWLVIASVFGSPRHKNKEYHERLFKKNKTYCCC